MRSRAGSGHRGPRVPVIEEEAIANLHGAAPDGPTAFDGCVLLTPGQPAWRRVPGSIRDSADRDEVGPRVLSYLPPTANPDISLARQSYPETQPLATFNRISETFDQLDELLAG